MLRNRMERNVVAAMPVAGLLFPDVFDRLYDIQYDVNSAKDTTDTGQGGSR